VVNHDGVTNIYGLAFLPGSSFRELQRVYLAGGHGVTEEDAGVALRNNGARASGPESNGRVLAGGAAGKVGSAYDDGIAGGLLAGGDEWRWVGRRWEAGEGEGTELAVLVGLGRYQGEVLSRDNLVGVDVLPNDEALAVEYR
jgi:hypothetical protein